MTFQTSSQGQNNRDENCPEGLKSKLRTLWLGMRDSNPRSWNQNPLPYHLANPQRHCVPNFSIHNFTIVNEGTSFKHYRGRWTLIQVLKY